MSVWVWAILLVISGWINIIWLLFLLALGLLFFGIKCLVWAVILSVLGGCLAAILPGLWEKYRLWRLMH